ncbi:AraC family transcriptional regulator [Arachidicoccus ginsenosidimutans]|uniref:AraC family transcriptional regulator n=1 Tax=Arachidicoccus sp. BS20 TaxID=1850526 RepID=UPI0007F134C8|nr:AraC family transcriptional regulator [Arachidicoccus sp. BS20]ANI88343.1 AraC family transcriptional regulator [Arachidicoccus sp. BS20]
MSRIKRKDGFEGQKLIALPESVLADYKTRNPAIGGVHITHIGYFPHAEFHYRQRRHGISDDILIYCLRGRGWFKIGDREFEMQPNQYIITPATTESLTYGTYEDDPWTIYWVHFSGSQIGDFNQSFGISSNGLPKDIPLNKKGLEIWEEMYQSLEMGFSIENLRNANLCLNHFLATFFYPGKSVKKEADEGDYITQTIIYMKAMLHEKLTVEDMAAKHNFSVSHFSTLFRKATGMPPIDYFIHLKVQRACQLLYDGKAKVKDVAESLGYDDPFYFSRLFKKYMKVSPEHYKSMHREED